MINKREIFDSIGVMRDTYKSKYDLIIKEYNSDLKKIEMYYKPGTPFYKNSTLEIENNKNSKIESLKNECRDFIDGEIFKIKSVIDAEICVLPTNETVINNLQRLYDLPLSKCEVEALAKRFDNSNYWTSKIVHDLAEKNGVTLPKKSEDAQTQYDILDNLSDRIDIFLNEWNGETESQYSARFSLADSQLIKLERRFTNNFQDGELSAKKNVQIALANISEQRDVFNQSRYLKTLYDNSDDLQKKYLLYELSKNNSIYDSSIRSSGLDYILDTFKTTKDYKMIDNSNKIIDSLRMTQEVDKDTILNTIDSNGGYNDYVRIELNNLYGSHNDAVNDSIKTYTDSEDNNSNVEAETVIE